MPFRCNEQYAGRVTISPSTQLCAASSVVGKDSCNGDSGGPLMRDDGVRLVVVGVTSFGTARCDSSVPGVYTNVANYVDWISAQMNA